MVSSGTGIALPSTRIHTDFPRPDLNHQKQTILQTSHWTPCVLQMTAPFFIGHPPPPLVVFPLAPSALLVGKGAGEQEAAVTHTVTSTVGAGRMRLDRK